MALEAAEVVKLIKSAKPNPIGFAFGLGASATAHVLVAERGKNGDQLVGLAKKQPGIKQTCGGSVSWDGSEAVFTADHPLPGLDKQIDAWLKANKQSLKISVLSAKAAMEKAAEDEEDEPGNALFLPETIEKYLKLAKTKDMHFAFGLGSKDDNLLGLHPRRDGEKLFLMVKKENGATKKCWGMVQLDGAKAIFTCEEKPVPGMKRHLRAMFKDWKLPYQVVIMGPDGEEDEEGGEGAEQENNEGAAGESPEIARMRAQLENARPRLDAAAAQDPARKAALDRDLARFEAAAGSGDAATARDALTALAQLVKAPAAQKDPALVKLRAQFENAQPRLLKTFTDAGRMDLYQAELAAFETAEAEGATDAARAALERLAAAARDAAGGSPGGSLVMLQKSRLAWDSLRKSVQSQLTELQKSITAAVSAHNRDEESPDEFDENELAQSFGKLGGILDKLDTRLIDKLDEALNAEGDDRRRHQQDAAAIVAEYQDYVAKDPLIAAIDDNGFLPLRIRQEAQAALNSLASQL